MAIQDGKKGELVQLTEDIANDSLGKPSTIPKDVKGTIRRFDDTIKLAEVYFGPDYGTTSVGYSKIDYVS